jgi:hypothetical protein
MKRSSSTLSLVLSLDNALAEFKTSADAEPVSVAAIDLDNAGRRRARASRHTLHVARNLLGRSSLVRRPVPARKFRPQWIKARKLAWIASQRPLGAEQCAGQLGQAGRASHEERAGLRLEGK